jgi:hypothetical protein
MYRNSRYETNTRIKFRVFWDVSPCINVEAGTTKTSASFNVTTTSQKTLHFILAAVRTVNLSKRDISHTVKVKLHIALVFFVLTDVQTLVSLISTLV